LEEKLPNNLKDGSWEGSFKNRPLESNTFYKILLARNKLLQDGYSEVMTYVFRDKGEVEVLASASGKNFLRDNLSEGLKESIKLNQLNLPLLEIDEVKVFEIGTIFSKEGPARPHDSSGAGGEEMHVAYGDKKNVVEISLDKFVSENISPDFLREKVLPLEGSRQVLEEQKIFKQWSMYPFITRDIAVWVPEGVVPEKLIEIYKSFGTELLIREPKLFDSFTKDGKTSFAYRLVFQSDERTLTDDEISQIMSKITEKIVSLGWQVR
jgi:phenylalanyl-tRNA synthetase beta subunit